MARSARLSRRTVLRSLAGAGNALAAGWLLAACGGAAPTPTQPVSKPAAAAATATTAPQPTAAAPSPTAAAQPTAAPTATTAPTAATKPAAAATPAAAPPKPGGAPATLAVWKGPHKPAGEETKQCAGPTLAMFEKAHPNTKVDFVEVPWRQYNEKFTTAFAAGAGPDVSYQTESFPRYVNAGHILPLDELIKSTNFPRDFFYPRAWEPTLYGGKTYAVPSDISGSHFFWNKELFEKAGLDPNKPPETLDDFVAHAQKLTKGDVYGFAADPRDVHEGGQWPRRYGGDWFDKDYAKSTIDSPEAIKGFQFLSDLFHKLKVAMPGAISGQEPGVRGYFRDGKVGMITYQSDLIDTMRKEKPNFKLAVARMAKGPAADPMGRACYGGIGMWAIAKTSKYPNEAWALASWLSSDPGALKSWMACLGFFSVSPKLNYYENDPLLSTAQDTMQYTFFWPYRGWVNKFWDIQSTGIESIVLGQKQVEDAVKEMDRKIGDLLRTEGAG